MNNCCLYSYFSVRKKLLCIEENNVSNELNLNFLKIIRRKKEKEVCPKIGRSMEMNGGRSCYGKWRQKKIVLSFCTLIRRVYSRAFNLCRC